MCYDFSEFAGHFVPKQLCCFLFYQARAEPCLASRKGTTEGALRAPLTGRGSWRRPAREQVALGQTASAAYAGRTTRRGPAASGFAGSLEVHVAGARSGAGAPAAHVGIVANQGQCRGRLATRPKARLFAVQSAHEGS